MSSFEAAPQPGRYDINALMAEQREVFGVPPHVVMIAEESPRFVSSLADDAQTEHSLAIGFARFAEIELASARRDLAAHPDLDLGIDLESLRRKAKEREAAREATFHGDVVATKVHAEYKQARRLPFWGGAILGGLATAAGILFFAPSGVERDAPVENSGVSQSDQDNRGQKIAVGILGAAAAIGVGAQTGVFAANRLAPRVARRRARREVERAEALNAQYGSPKS